MLKIIEKLKSRFNPEAVAGKNEEFIKRTGYVLMAQFAVHDKKVDNRKFEQFFPMI